ncbi:CBO0543 family protein [Paenibacillus sp. GCM10027628]|uniref:CBO0543 family protein n=1 Tax=Paenibacillus sp. GCM10027628 TaxID=3273413 RepID=UPI003626683D
MPNEIDELNRKANQMEMDWWLHHDLFSFQWWIIVIVNVLFFALLLFYIDRKRTLKITLALLFSFIIVGTFDQIGIFFQWWSYPHQFIAFTEQYNAADFFVVPCIFALIYQWFAAWRSFLVANLAASVVIAFIGEPIFVALGIYKLNNWSYLKSFLVLFVIAILVKAIVDWIGENKLQVNADRELTIDFNKSKQKIR